MTIIEKIAMARKCARTTDCNTCPFINKCNSFEELLDGLADSLEMLYIDIPHSCKTCEYKTLSGYTYPCCDCEKCDGAENKWTYRGNKE